MKLFIFLNIFHDDGFLFFFLNNYSEFEILITNRSLIEDLILSDTFQLWFFFVSGESDNGFCRPPHFGRLHEGLEVLFLFSCWITKFNSSHYCSSICLRGFSFRALEVLLCQAAVVKSVSSLLLTCSASRGTFLGKRCVYQSRRD